MRRILRLAVGLFHVLIISGAAQAADQVYRWMDSDGVMHFSDQPPASASPAVPTPLPSTSIPGPAAASGGDYYSPSRQLRRMQQERLERQKARLELQAARQASVAPKQPAPTPIEATPPPASLWLPYLARPHAGYRSHPRPFYPYFPQAPQNRPTDREGPVYRYPLPHHKGAFR